jgi:hypothetical protein
VSSPENPKNSAQIGDDVMLASLNRVHVHEDVAQAEESFQDMTRDRSHVELVERALAQRQPEVRADPMTRRMAEASIPLEGERFEDVPGVGDAARFNVVLGEIIGRVDRTTFIVSAYRGPAFERPNGPKTADRLGEIAARRAASDAWVAEHRQVRRALSAAVAREVAARL